MASNPPPYSQLPQGYPPALPPSPVINNQGYSQLPQGYPPAPPPSPMINNQGYSHIPVYPYTNQQVQPQVYTTTHTTTTQNDKNDDLCCGIALGACLCCLCEMCLE